MLKRPLDNKTIPSAIIKPRIEQGNSAGAVGVDGGCGAGCGAVGGDVGVDDDLIKACLGDIAVVNRLGGYDVIEKKVMMCIKNEKCGKNIHPITWRCDHCFYRIDNIHEEIYIRGDCVPLSIIRFLHDLSLMGILKKLRIAENIWEKYTLLELRQHIVDASIRNGFTFDKERVRKPREGMCPQHISIFLRSINIPESLNQIFETDNLVKYSLKESEINFNDINRNLKLFRTIILADSCKNGVDAGMRILFGNDYDLKFNEENTAIWTATFERLYKKAERLKRNEELIHNECVAEGLYYGCCEHFKQKIATYALCIAKYKYMLEKGEKKRKEEMIEKMNEAVKEISRNKTLNVLSGSLPKVFSFDNISAIDIVIIETDFFNKWYQQKPRTI